MTLSVFYITIVWGKQSFSQSVDIASLWRVDAVCADLAIVIQSGGGRFVAGGLSVNSLRLALGGGQMSIGAGLARGVVLWRIERGLHYLRLQIVLIVLSTQSVKVTKSNHNKSHYYFIVALA